MTLQRPLFMQAAGGDTAFSYAALATRQMYDIAYATEGVVSLGLQVTQRGAGANMSVDVAAGSCVIFGDDVSGQGKYMCVNDAGALNVVVPAAPVSGTRIHRVVARIKDKLHNGTWTTYEWTIELLADTGSGTPALPASAISLARVTVVAGQVTVVTANITDDRTSALLAPARPLQVASDAGRVPNPVAGEMSWRTDKGYSEVYTGSSWQPMYLQEPLRFKRKSIDQTLTSSTTVINDTDLVITDLTVNRIYKIEGYLVLIGNDTGNIKFGFSLPSGASIGWTPDALNTSPGNDAGSIRRPHATSGSARSVGATISANGGPLAAKPLGLLTMGSSTGTFLVQFAQVVSNATATGLGAGSWIQATPVQ
jgi:hypothetical protein